MARLPATSPSIPLAPAEPGAYLVAKRLFDIAFAVSLLVFTLPLWLLTALAITLTSRGPVFFKQTRCGRNGDLFTVYKFRTMVADAEQRKAELLHLNEVGGKAFKIQRDPRITPVGRWLRKLSIDELPQLLNVIKGEMSVVGPRAPLPAEVANYTEHEMNRLAVTPGLTCLWQVSGRSNVSWEQWVEMDLEYIRRRGFWYDLVLVVLTVPAVVTGRGAM